MPDSLVHIINGCKNGDRKAQRELYVYFKDKMFGICRRYAGNYDDAEDILQDGFVRIFEKIGQFRFEGSFEGWVRRIMVNTALEKYRMHCKIININDSVKEIENSAAPPAGSEINVQELLTFVSELSPKYRMVFNLYAIEGYSHKEIGEMLDISEGTSKSNLSRARYILQEKVNTYFNAPVKAMK